MCAYTVCYRCNSREKYGRVPRLNRIFAHAVTAGTGTAVRYDQVRRT